MKDIKKVKVDNKPKFVSNVVRQVVDHETGELLDQTVEKHFVTKVDTDSFFMVFIENLAPFFGLKQAGDVRLIIAMCKVADFNTGVVKMTKKTRMQLCEDANISVSNMNKNLKRLVECGLISEEDGEYTINPNIFWKGSTTTRTEVLKSDGLVFQIKLVEQS